MNGMLQERLTDPVLLAVFPRLDGDFSLDRVFFQLRREAFSRPDFHCKGRRKQFYVQNEEKRIVRYTFDFGGKNFVEWEKKIDGKVVERAFCQDDQSYCVKTYRTSVFVSKIDYYTNSHQWSRTEFFCSPGEKELRATITRDFLTDQITLRKDGKENALVRIPGLVFQDRLLLEHVQRQAGLPEAVLFSQKEAFGYCLQTELEAFLHGIACFYGKDAVDGQAQFSELPEQARSDSALCSKAEPQPKSGPRHAAPSPPTALVLRRARAALQRAREDENHA